jgi:uncharacterized membrane protein YraQ (UPF0718 family)
MYGIVSLRIVFGLLIALVAGWSTSYAKADEWSLYYQTTCAPKLDYFHVETIAVDNVQSWQSSDDEALREQGIYLASTLEDATQHCTIGKDDIAFGGTYKQPAASGGACAGAADSSFWLSVNGRVIYETKNFYDSCNGGKLTSIIADTLQVEVCLSERNPRGDLHKERDMKQTCTTLHLMPLPL